MITKISVGYVLLLICTLLTVVVVIMSIIKKDYRQMVEFLVGYSGLIMIAFQSKITDLLMKLF